jgi:hypothetical protein
MTAPIRGEGILAGLTADPPAQVRGDVHEPGKLPLQFLEAGIAPFPASARMECETIHQP